MENEAETMQSKYPKAKNLQLYLDTLSHYADAVRKEQRKTERFIAEIPDQRVREIACYRLLEGLTWQEIAELMNLSFRYVQRLWSQYRDGKESTEKRC